MLRDIKDIEGCTIGATDGIIGRIIDCYFDDDAWIVRYLIVRTNDRGLRNKVLIPPAALGRPDWHAKLLPVTITRNQVRRGPEVDTNLPVSRPQEMGYLAYFGYGVYWGGGGLGGASVKPENLRKELQVKRIRGEAQTQHDPQLRSCNVITRNYVNASDGDIGHIDGFLIDDKSWAIRYLIVDTSNWCLGHQVLVAPARVKSVNWAESTLSVDLTRQALMGAPQYDAMGPLDPGRLAVFDHYYGQDARSSRDSNSPANRSRMAH
jgi:hypothetical protein